MRVQVDSNIPLRLAHAADAQHQLTTDAVATLLQKPEQLCLLPQNAYEFWVVATRPTNVNGLGFTFTQVQGELAKLKQIFFHLDETPAVFAEWEKLVSAHAIIGKNVHDAHLVAAMVVHGITHLLTFNRQDFQRFTNIIVWTPTDVMANP